MRFVLFLVLAGTHKIQIYENLFKKNWGLSCKIQIYEILFKRIRVYQDSFVLPHWQASISKIQSHTTPVGIAMQRNTCVRVSAIDYFKAVRPAQVGKYRRLRRGTNQFVIIACGNKGRQFVIYYMLVRLTWSPLQFSEHIPQRALKKFRAHSSLQFSEHIPHRALKNLELIPHVVLKNAGEVGGKC